MEDLKCLLKGKFMALDCGHRFCLHPWSNTLVLTATGHTYCHNCYLFKNELGESEQQRKRKKILRYIATRGGQVKRGQLIRSKVLPGSVKEYDGVINTLLSEGSLDVDKSASQEYEWIYILK